MYFLAFLLRCTPTSREAVSHAPNSFVEKHLQDRLLRVFEEQVNEPSHSAQPQRVQVTMARIRDQGQDVTLRATLVGHEALTTLHNAINALSGQSIVVPDEMSYQVTVIDVVHPQWSAMWGWADMLHPCYNRCIHLQFVTPVQLTFPGTNTWCFPNASVLFTELYQSWQQLHGPALPDGVTNYLKDGECVVSDYHLSLQQEHKQNTIRSGFCGSIMYDCRTRNMAYIAALHSLARLAFFTGVGSATRYGMGVIRVQKGRQR